MTWRRLAPKISRRSAFDRLMWSPGGHDTPASGVTRLPAAPPEQHRHRQPTFQRFGDRHPVAFPVGRQCEQVSRTPKLFQRRVVDLARKAHIIRDVQFLGERHQRARIDRIAIRRTDDGELPVEIEQPCHRAQQHVVALAPHQRADRDDAARRPPGSRTARRVIGARHDHCNAFGRNAEINSEPFAGHPAGDDDARKPRQQTPLDRQQRSPVAFAEPCLQCGRVMDQADRMPCGQRIVHSGEGRQPQAVDDRARCVGQCGPRGACGIACSRIGQRMAARKFDNLHGMPCLAQSRDDAAVIRIAAGDGIARRGYDQRHMHQSIDPS